MTIHEHREELHKLTLAKSLLEEIAEGLRLQKYPGNLGEYYAVDTVHLLLAAELIGRVIPESFEI